FGRKTLFNVKIAVKVPIFSPNNVKSIFNMKNIAVAALIVLFFFHLANAQLPFRLRQNVFSGLSLPVFLTNAGDGTRRIFIVQQRGI
ncbi:hypothetical protein OFN43_31365, partial [Escherichia coli]|nr:hypothetical protein [Escherichia coli]